MLLFFSSDILFVICKMWTITRLYRAILITKWNNGIALDKLWLFYYAYYFLRLFHIIKIKAIDESMLIIYEISIGKKCLYLWEVIRWEVFLAKLNCTYSMEKIYYFQKGKFGSSLSPSYTTCLLCKFKQVSPLTSNQYADHCW